MQIQPLSKSLYDRAKELNVTKIILGFQGGSDEGYLNVELAVDGVGYQWYGDPSLRQLAQDIEKWAWDVYYYNGAGDGTDYGDDITYDIESGKATSQAWYMEAKYDNECDQGKFGVVDDSEELDRVEV